MSIQNLERIRDSFLTITTLMLYALQKADTNYKNNNFAFTFGIKNINFQMKKIIIIIALPIKKQKVKC